ncbi:DNA polymerase III subunit delta [Vibrio quintilis]|uniref:DNA polymerase III subunit delta n=1 Tax=Vibrio quintilis TaxID=1117707 RepID=A0A1M7YZB5_9VIBR|nr:DNA polymerase III subunit delta [Vibrio quintilis]SHO57998.1 DNA polymerase III subunit delta [Vibrio quintilis]
MRIFAESLAGQLHQQLLPVYLIFGNEPLLIQESKAAVKAAAKNQGVDTFCRYQVDSSLNWDEVFEHFQTLSLFSSRQLVELTLPDSFTASVTSKLLTLSTLVNQDTTLVINGPKLTKAQENTKWYKALTTNGCHVNCLSPDLNRLPQFVLQRCKGLGLSPDKETIQMLAQWHEGNLLALVQSLEKLALLYPDGQLTVIRVEASLSRHNHFSVFHWIDALLDGKSNRCQRILRQLKAEGTEPVILLRSVQKELYLLLELQSQKDHQDIYHLMNQYRIWKNKRPFYIHALERLNLPAIHRLIHQLSHLESVTKLQYNQDPWPLLQQLSIDFTQVRQTSTVSPVKHDIM